VKKNIARQPTWVNSRWISASANVS